MSDFFSMKDCIDKAFLYVRDNLFSEKTCLIYDHIVNGREDEFPTPSEIGELYPNPCGYTTGMEDGMISGGTMLDACLLKYERENDPAAAEFSRKLVCGMLNCAESAKTEGFLPRAVSPADGKSLYVLPGGRYIISDATTFSAFSSSVTERLPFVTIKNL